MKTLRVSLALLLSSGVFVHAQAPVAQPTPTPAPAPAAPLRSSAELEELLAPIALYPDALIALILPASTVPADIVLAARHLRDSPNDTSQIEHRAWDESVKSLVSYPEVLKWMDENLEWTRQVGAAFLAQPADVMQAVQRLRAKARAAGTLVDTPQQQVIAESEVIRIVPAQPDVIYVPHYEPEIVFVDRPVYYPQPVLTFGIGVPVGSWLAFDCDWHRRTIWCVDRHRRWTGHDWHRPLAPVATNTFTRTYYPPAGVRQWQPPPQPFRPTIAMVHHNPEPIIRPVPLGWTHPRSIPTPNPVIDGRNVRTSPNPLPAVNPLPRAAFTTVPGNPNDLPGPRVAPSFNARPTVVTPPVTAVTPAPALPVARSFTPPAARRSAEAEAPHVDTRPRMHHVPAPIPTASSLPMASAPQPAPVAGPVAAPVTPRAYSHPMPAPAAVPSLPMAQHSAPAPVAAPAPAPQAAPPSAPAHNDNGNRSIERRTDQRER
jgi:hypothetical protein